MPYPSLSTYTAVIANGAAVSATIQLRDQPLAGIQMDAAWTAAKICFDVSFDDVTWGPLYNALGDEFALTVPATANAFIALSPFDFSGARFIRLRSGLTGATVNQGAQRTLSVIARLL